MRTKMLHRLLSYMLVGTLILAGSISTGNLSYATTETGKGILFPLGGMTQWLGAFHTPGINELTWCIDMGHTGIPEASLAHHSALPDQLSDLGISEDLRVVSTVEAAWLLYQYQDIDETISRAALAFIIHASFDKETASWGNLNGREKIHGTLAYLQNHYPQVLDKVREYVAQARNQAIKMPLQVTHSYSGEESGMVSEIGVLNHAGNYVAGQRFALRLVGPAVFDSNGSDMIIGETANKPLNYSWHATGNGDVKVRIRYEELPGRELTKLVQDANYQDMITTALVPTGRTTSLLSETGFIKVFYDFQPELKSQVQEAVTEGETATDIVDVYATKAGAGQWLKSGGKPIPIKWRVELHYLGEAFPAKSQMRSLKQVASFNYVTPGPGRYQVSAPIKEKGFYTWVWKMRREDQGKHAKHVISNWQDPLGLEAETLVKPSTPQIQSQQNLISTRGGSDAKFYLNDWIEQSGFPTDHPNFAGYGGIGADRKEVNHYLYCVKDPKSDHKSSLETELLTKDTASPKADPNEKNKSNDKNVPGGKENSSGKEKPDEKDKPVVKTLVWEGTTPARNGTFTIATLNNSPGLHVQALDCRGRLVFVSEFKGDDRVKAIRTDLNDPKESYLPAPPQITTAALDAQNHTKYLSNTSQVCIKDQVSYRELAAGEEYTLVTYLGDKTTRTLITENQEPLKTRHTFTPVHRNGSETTSICVDREKLLGKQVVVFQSLERNGKAPIMHENWDDQEQTLYAPQLRTKAWNKVAGKNEKEIYPSLEEQKIYDELELSGGMPEQDYWVKVDIKDPRGQEFTSLKLLEITPAGSSQAAANSEIGTANILRLRTDAQGQAKLIVTASLSPKELRQRYQDQNRIKWENMILEKVKATATPQSYQALQAYFTGSITRKELDKTLSKTEIAILEANPEVEEKSLSENITFTENIYADAQLTQLLYQHQDLDNPQQQLLIKDFPRIHTSAQAAGINSKILSAWERFDADSAKTEKSSGADPKVKVQDTVAYQNLIPGSPYRLRASLRAKNGQEIAHKHKDFTPQAPNGQLDITIPVDISKHWGASLVFFEELYQLEAGEEKKPENKQAKKADKQTKKPEKLVAEHKDLDSHPQTLTVPLVRSRLLPEETSRFTQGTAEEAAHRESAHREVAATAREAASADLDKSKPVAENSYAPAISAAREVNPKTDSADPAKTITDPAKPVTKPAQASPDSLVIAELSEPAKGENRQKPGADSAPAKEIILNDYLYYAGLEPGRSYSFRSQLVNANTKEVIPLKDFKALRFTADESGKALVKYRVDSSQAQPGQTWVSTQELYEETPQGKRLLFRDYDLSNSLQSYVHPTLALTGVKSRFIFAFSLWALAGGVLLVRRNPTVSRKS